MEMNGSGTRAQVILSEIANNNRMNNPEANGLSKTIAMPFTHEPGVSDRPGC